MATKTTAKTPINWTYLAGRTIAAAFLLGALAASYTHIVHLFNMLGLHGWQALTAPAFVDGFAMLGRLARSRQFSGETRRVGLKVQIVATSISFIANVVAGDSFGARLYGALVVIGYVVAELLSERMSPGVTEEQATAAKRTASATKAAATRKANAEAKRTADAQRAELVAARKARATLARKATAPVSPAPLDSLDSL